MTLTTLLVLHLMAGAGVGVAVYVTATGAIGSRVFQVVSAIVFWPMYLPLLLTNRTSPTASRRPTEKTTTPDELGRSIAVADAELDGALRSLDGWAEDVLAREKDRLDDLRQAWLAQAERIREMDRLLAEETEADLPAPARLSERVRQSRETVRHNRDRLRQVRQRTHDDLLWTLTWVRELVSMIHLAKFTGAPASRAEELVAQIAAAVEGLSALTCLEEVGRE